MQIKLRAKSTYRMWQGCAKHRLLQAIAGASGRPTRAVNGRVACLVPLQPAEKTDINSRLPVCRGEQNNKKGGLPYKICPRRRHMSSHSRSLSAPLACCQLLRGGQPIRLAATHKPSGVGGAPPAVLKTLGQSEPCSGARVGHARSGVGHSGRLRSTHASCEWERCLSRAPPACRKDRHPFQAAGQP